MFLFSSQIDTLTRSMKNFFQLKKFQCLYRCKIKLVWPKALHSKQSYCIQCPKKLPLIMKLSSSEFKSVITDGVKFLQDLFEKNGFELRIAGGAVRDLLLGNKPHDIDLATTATPDEMKDLFTKHEIRLINIKGESHGTVTPRINDVNYEITTLRIDKITNGRHAVVEFTKNWFLDANRRDLTINAMFLDLDGNVYDYFNGMEDLKNRRVVFVGDAVSRIQEDYLRILRYFRFFGRISLKPDCHDEKTMLAIKENASGLENVSGERIQGELFKIISGNYGIELLKKMLNLDLGRYIGLPQNCNIEELDRVTNNIRSNNFVVEPMTILCSLLRSSDDVSALLSRIKPPAYCRDLAYFIVEEKKKENPLQTVREYQKMQIFSKNPKLMGSVIVQYLQYMGAAQILREFEEFNYGDFPINGYHILQKEIKDRRQLGFIMRELKSMWIESNFTLTKEELEDMIIEVSKKYDSQNIMLKRKNKRGHNKIE